MKIAMLCAGLVSPAAFAGPDSPELRAAAAERYLKVRPVSEIVDELLPMTEVALKGVTDGQTQKYVDMVRKLVRMKWLEQKARDELVKLLTTDELDALTRLYGSADGASAMRKLHYELPLWMSVRAEVDRAAICVGPDEAARKTQDCGDIKEVD